MARSNKWPKEIKGGRVTLWFNTTTTTNLFTFINENMSVLEKKLRTFKIHRMVIKTLKHG